MANTALLTLILALGLAAAGAQQGASSALAAGQPAAWNLTAPGPVSVLATTLPAAAAPVEAIVLPEHEIAGHALPAVIVPLSSAPSAGEPAGELAATEAAPATAVSGAPVSGASAAASSSAELPHLPSLPKLPKLPKLFKKHLPELPHPSLPSLGSTAAAASTAVSGSTQVSGATISGAPAAAAPAAAAAAASASSEHEGMFAHVEDVISKVAVRPVEEELYAASTASVPMYAWVLPSGGAASTTASAATTPGGAASSASAVVEAADGPSPMRQAPSPAAAPAPPPAASAAVQAADGPMPMPQAPMSPAAAPAPPPAASAAVQAADGPMPMPQAPMGPAAAPASPPAASAAVLAADGPTPMQQWLSPTAAPASAPGGQRCWSVLEVAQQVPSLADFAAALNATGLGGRAGAPSTVFAFTDAALDTVLAALQQPLSAVLARPAFIRQVVDLHVVPGRALRAADLAAGDKLATLLGQSLTIARAGGTILVQPPSQGPSAAVVYADIPACGSVVHVIDAVLEPLAS